MAENKTAVPKAKKPKPVVDEGLNDDDYKVKVDKVRKKLATMGGDDKWLKLKPDSKVRGRILPPWGRSADGSWFYTGGLHYGFSIGGQDRALPCLAYRGEDCPVCEVLTAMQAKMGQDEDLDDIFKEFQKEHRKQEKSWFNVATLIKDDESGKLIATGKILIGNLSGRHLKKIQAWAEDEDYGPTIFDPKTGHNIIFSRTGESKYQTRYDVEISPRATDIKFPGDWRTKVHQLDKVVMEWMSRKEEIKVLWSNEGEVLAMIKDDLPWTEEEKVMRKKKLKGKKNKKREEEEDDEDESEDDE